MKNKKILLIVICSFVILLIIGGYVFYAKQIKKKAIVDRKPVAFETADSGFVERKPIPVAEAVARGIDQGVRAVTKKILDKVSEVSENINNNQIAQEVEEISQFLSKKIETLPSISGSSSSGPDNTTVLGNLEDQMTAKIKLSDEYSIDDFTVAAGEFSSNKTSEKSQRLIKQVFGEINNAMAEKDNQMGNNAAKADLLIRVVDSSGKSISDQMLKQTLKKSNFTSYQNKAHAANSADNFDFSFMPPIGTGCSPVSDQVKNELISDYSKVESIYGPRFTSLYDPSLRKIRVCQTEVNYHNRLAYYSPEFNLIAISKDGVNNSTLVHELIHAFHGLAVISPSFWDEGFAQTVEYGIVPDEADKWNFTAFTEAETLLNLPFNDYNMEANEFIEPYKYGFAYFEKIYMTNPNFFKDFNSLLFSRIIQLEKTQFTNEQYSDIAINSIKNKIEGLSGYDWLALHYAFWKVRPHYVPIYLKPSQYVLLSKTDKSSFYVMNSSPVQKYSVKVYDFKNNLISSFSENQKQTTKTVGMNSYDYFPTLLPPSIADYEGIIHVVISTTGGTDGDKHEYFVKTKDDSIKYPIYGIVPGVASGKITVKGANSTYDGEITNGIFIVKNCDFSKSGVYQVQITQDGLAVSAILNKIDMLGYTVIVGNQQIDGQYTLN